VKTHPKTAAPNHPETVAKSTKKNNTCRIKNAWIHKHHQKAIESFAHCEMVGCKTRSGQTCTCEYIYLLSINLINHTELRNKSIDAPPRVQETIREPPPTNDFIARANDNRAMPGVVVVAGLHSTSENREGKKKKKKRLFFFFFFFFFGAAVFFFFFFFFFWRVFFWPCPRLFINLSFKKLLKANHSSHTHNHTHPKRQSNLRCELIFF
jgi:hypothetical protein